jgi:hypothetical protein
MRDDKRHRVIPLDSSIGDELKYSDACRSTRRPAMGTRAKIIKSAGVNPPHPVDTASCSSSPPTSRSLGNSGDPEELEIEAVDPSNVSDSSNKEGSGGTEDAETEPGDPQVVETGTGANDETSGESGNLAAETPPSDV